MWDRRSCFSHFCPSPYAWDAEEPESESTIWVIILYCYTILPLRNSLIYGNYKVIFTLTTQLLPIWDCRCRQLSFLMFFSVVSVTVWSVYLHHLGLKNSQSFGVSLSLLKNSELFSLKSFPFLPPTVCILAILYFSCIYSRNKSFIFMSPYF